MPRRYIPVPAHLRKHQHRVGPVLNWLLKHGKPATVKEIAKGTGLSMDTVQHTLQKKRPETVFTRCGSVPREHTPGVGHVLWIAWEENDE